MSAASMLPSHMIASHRATGAKTPSCGTASQARCTKRANPQNVASAHDVRATLQDSGRNTPIMAVNKSEGMKTVRKLIEVGFPLSSRQSIATQSQHGPTRALKQFFRATGSQTLLPTRSRRADMHGTLLSLGHELWIYREIDLAASRNALTNAVLDALYSLLVAAGHAELMTMINRSSLNVVIDWPKMPTAS
jgi:hypothetical protein